MLASRAAFLALLAVVLVLTLGAAHAGLEGRTALRVQSEVDRHLPPGEARRSASTPARVEQDRGLVIAHFTDAMANVALFVPLGVALALGWPYRRWRLVVLLSALSAIIELLQATVVTSRSAELSDWIANSLGATLGVLVTRACARHVAARKA